MLYPTGVPRNDGADGGRIAFRRDQLQPNPVVVIAAFILRRPVHPHC
jgi:hypothetical protein